MDKSYDDQYVKNQVTKFVNSNDFPEALQRLAEEVPFDIFRTLLSRYLNVITSILDKMFEVMGLEMENPEALEKNIEQATERLRFLTWVMMEVLKDPTIRENIRQLAIALNDSALKPFLEAALVTMDEMRPSIDSAVEKVEEKVHTGIRKVIDAGGNAVLSGLGTVPYFGNILNATDTIANVLMGVQAIGDTFVGLLLETTFRLLLIMKKVKGPGLDAVDSFIDFGLNAYNTYQSVVSKVDAINAMAKGANFDPNQKLISKKEYVKKVQGIGEKSGMVETPDVKLGAKPTTVSLAKPGAKQVQKGGAKSKKKHQKKRTRKGRFRKTKKKRGGMVPEEEKVLEDEKVEEAIKLPAAAPEQLPSLSPSIVPENNKSEKKEEVVFSMGNVELNAKKSNLSNFVDKVENYKKVQDFLTKLHVSNVPTQTQLKSAINNSQKVIEFNKQDRNRSNIVKITSVLLPKLSKKPDILYNLTK